MKQWIIGVGCSTLLVILGMVGIVSAEPTDDPVYSQPKAYVEGATPPHIQNWEMY